MKWAEAFVITVVMILVGILFCVSIPRCSMRKNEAINKCVEVRPNLTPHDCLVFE